MAATIELTISQLIKVHTLISEIRGQHRIHVDDNKGETSMKLSFYQRHQTRKAVALLTLFAFLLLPMAAIAEPRPCPSGGSCCPALCSCDPGCCGSGLDDIGPYVEDLPPIVIRIIEIYNDIADFITGDSDSGSCSN